MKQKPFNDNLVMASIESLYEQASHTGRSSVAALRRHDPKKLPIIGSLPVQVGQQDGTNELDDVVLTGRLHTAFTVENRNNVSDETDPDKEQKGNPFLEIRQAVIAAGNNNNQKFERPETLSQTTSQPDTECISARISTFPDQPLGESTEQTFARHLADLIDAEIERRMAVRLHNIKQPSNKKTSATESNPKQRKKPKKLKKAKEKAAREPTTKKSSTKKRIKPR